MTAKLREFHRPYEGTDYTWRRRILRSLIRTFVFPTLFKVEAYGVENVPAKGGTILMVNHTAIVEPIAVAGVVDRLDLVPMSKVENFHTPLVSWFVRNWGSFSVRRGEIDRNALGYGVDVLTAGGSLLIAPEGTRRPRLKRAHSGLAFMATHANAVLVPVGVDGAKHFMKRLRAPLKLRFGRPFRFATDEFPNGQIPREVLDQMTYEAMCQLAVLLPENLRGYYSDLDQMTTDYLCFIDPSSDCDYDEIRPAA
jgi:1-acyl-sn-glycerol-3-phosphate acyltransferase